MAKIVVGVDGSAGSEAAVQWAYDEAALRGASLHLVHCWDYPYLGTLDAIGRDVEIRERVETAARAVVEQARASVVDAHPEGTVEVTTALLDEPAGPGLLREAADADMIVVGSRGRGGFTGLLLGSVSQRVVTHAHVPVVVIPAAAVD